MVTKTGLKISAAVYCRVSTMDQVAGVLTVKGSLEEQAQLGQAYAKAQGWDVVKTYIEPGVSGEKFEERLALQTMLDDARESKFQVLVVKAGDRLARDQAVFFRITKILNQFYNVQILNLANPSQIVAPQNFNGRRNPMLIVQQGFDAMMAAFDQARRTDMLIEGKKRQVRAGRYIFSSVCYGYQIDKQIIGENKVERIPVPNPDEYWVIELLPELVLREHLSDREIAQRLEELGARPSQAQHWHHNVVRMLLKNPFYAGKITYGRKAGRVDEDGTVHYFNNPDEEKVILADHHYQHPWTWETYEAIQAERGGRASQAARTRVSRSPVAGILKCGYCGGTMMLNPGNHKGRIIERMTLPDGSIKKIYDTDRRSQPYFHCSFNDRTSGTCQRNQLPARDVLIAVRGYLDELLKLEKENPDNFYKTMHRTETFNRQDIVARRIVETTKELKEEIPAQIDRLNKGFLKGVVTEEQYPELTRTIGEEKKRIETALVGLEAEFARLEAANFQEKRFNQFLRDYERYRELFDRDVNNWNQVEVRMVKHSLASYFDKILAHVERPGKGMRGKTFIHFEPKPLL